MATGKKRYKVSMYGMSNTPIREWVTEDYPTNANAPHQASFIDMETKKFITLVGVTNLVVEEMD